MKKPDGAIQLDVARLYEALDREQCRLKLTHLEVADRLDVSYATLACWRRGGGMNADAAVRLALWLRVDLRAYTRQPADPLPGTQKAA